jgi:2-isopropylmalate synthase
VYSGVPAAMVGRSQEIEIGPMSGESNIKYWLERRKINPDRELMEKIIETAKRSDRLLTDEEIYELIEQARQPLKNN